jgi:serine protease Do
MIVRRSAAQLRNRVGLARIGEQVTLTIERGATTQNLVVAVGPPMMPTLRWGGKTQRR